MDINVKEKEDQFLDSLKAFQEAPSFSRKVKLERLLSQIDMLCRTEEGMNYIYDKLPGILRHGLFEGTVWDNPNNLVAGLVSGTLLAGHPSTTLEVLSELRLLAIAEERYDSSHMTPEQARAFLEDVMVSNFEFIREDFSDASWAGYSQGELKKIRMLFDLLSKHITLGSLKLKLHLEVETLIAHRPIMTGKLEKMLRVLDRELSLNESEEVDRHLLRYISALQRPTSRSTEHPEPEGYEKALPGLKVADLKEEASEMGSKMLATGLVSGQQVLLLRHLARRKPALIPTLLSLDSHGRAEYERHQDFVLMLIQEFVILANRQAVYGLARILQRNLFSRPITWNALNRLLRIEIHPEVAESLLKSNHSEYTATPMQLLIGGVINVLGHPLGVRQGNNPTCQSARGISMWSRHAPGKLINLLTDAVAANNIAMRYEGDIIESKDIQEGLVRQFDFKLDPVSVVLVQHLDKIYNTMMKRAAIKQPGSDPHVSVNPAFYGQWIQAGFTSVYNPVLGAITDYEQFVKVFYASFHPEYNGGYHLIYPVPLGIFQTNTSAQMTGYHAVSLLRVEQDPDSEWRAYFFNPNSTGRQNWGQDIRPNVSGKGEKPGESSLPVHQFVARVYAFHYNQIQLGDKPEAIPANTVDAVRQLALESWGKKYMWL